MKLERFVAMPSGFGSNIRNCKLYGVIDTHVS